MPKNSLEILENKLGIPKRCNNPNCSICVYKDQYFYGSGLLNTNGSWEFPCFSCKEYFEAYPKELPKNFFILSSNLYLPRERKAILVKLDNS